MCKVIGIGETVFNTTFRNDQPIGVHPDGSTFNGLISLGRSGVHTTFVSETGNDRVGNMIRRFLKQNSVDVSRVNTFPDSKPLISLAFLNEKNDAEYLFYKDHPHDQLGFAFPDIQLDDIVIFGSYYAVNPIIRSQIVGLLDYIHNHGAVIYYDVSFKPVHQHDVMHTTPNPSESLEYTDIVRGSREDFQALYKLDDTAKVYQAEILPYCKRFIYTQGAEALQSFAEDNFRKTYPVPNETPVNTIGVSDSFDAGVLFGLLRHSITRQMLERGLSRKQWDQVISYGLHFASESCKSIHSYIDTSLTNQMKVELVKG